MRLCGRLLACALFACASYAQPALQGEAFHTVLASDELIVAARVMPLDNGQQRYALAMARMAESTPAGLRLASEWLLAVDCLATPRQVATVRQLRNARPIGEPVQWTEVMGGPALTSSQDWAALSFVPVQLVGHSAGQYLQLPDAWYVVSYHVCAQLDGAARMLGAPPPDGGLALRWSAVMVQQPADAAAQVSRHAGLPDVTTWRCPLTDRVGHRAGELELAFSPLAGAVRVNDKWVANGLLDPRFLGFEQNGITFRFIRETAVLRLIQRDEMQLVASARCVLVTPRNAVKSGW